MSRWPSRLGKAMTEPDLNVEEVARILRIPRVLGPLVCGNSKGNSSGGEDICFLNPQLTCQSRTGFSSGAAAPYAINESGVKVGNKVVPWVNPQEAVVDAIHTGAS
jgi:hypothetical protein